MTVVRKLGEIVGKAAAMLAIEKIFFEASTKQLFADEVERTAFRERWLGRYIRQYPEWVYVAFDAEGTVIGYLVGCIEDPTGNEHFADIEYFKTFQALLTDFPAHLHINLDARIRGQGIGKLLIEAFAADAKSAGARGMHVVTGRGVRNVRFYEQCGFKIVGTSQPPQNSTAFLGRSFIS